MEDVNMNALYELAPSAYEEGQKGCALNLTPCPPPIPREMFLASITEVIDTSAGRQFS